MKSKSLVRLALSLLLCLAVGALEGLVTRPEIPAWYAGLAKPPWTPAPLVFPIAWTVLYILMAVSFWQDAHPTLDAPSFAAVDELRRTVIGLPVHQELSRADLEVIVAAARGHARTQNVQPRLERLGPSAS